jgi:hypothetical protein
MNKRGIGIRSRIESPGQCLPALYEQQATNQVYRYSHDAKDTRATNTEVVK